MTAEDFIEAATRLAQAGKIDGYPEYTGTAYTAILKHQPTTDPQAAYERINEAVDAVLAGKPRSLELARSGATSVAFAGRGRGR